MSGEEVKWFALLNRQPQAVREVLGIGLITPEMTGPEASVGTPIPRLSLRASDIRGLDIAASGLVVVTQLSQGVVVGKRRVWNNVDVPQEVLVEPVEIGMPGAYVA